MKTITIQISDDKFEVKLQNDSGEVKTWGELNPNENSIIFAAASVLLKGTTMTAAFSNNNPKIQKILKILQSMKTDNSTMLW